MKQILCYDSLYNTISVAGTAADIVACREFRSHVKERAAELLYLPENEVEELLEMGGDEQTFFYNEEAGSASFFYSSGDNVEIQLADAPDPLRNDLLVALKEEAGLDEYAPVPPDKKEEWEKLAEEALPYFQNGLQDQEGFWNIYWRECRLALALAREENYEYELFQLSEKAEDLLWIPYDRLTAGGKKPLFENYVSVHKGSGRGLEDKKILEDLFTVFNTKPPLGYMGRSMSVSDVVAIRRQNSIKWYYCDRFGFVELEGFVEEKEPLPEILQ